MREMPERSCTARSRMGMHKTFGPDMATWRHAPADGFANRSPGAVRRGSGPAGIARLYGRAGGGRGARSGQEARAALTAKVGRPHYGGVEAAARAARHVGTLDALPPRR